MYEYKHGTYGEIVGSISGDAAKSGTVAVYVGCAPTHLVADGSKYENEPILLSSMEDVYKYCGYSDDWITFDLCAAFYAHFNNPMGNVGPIVAINCWLGDGEMSDTYTESLLFSNGRATIKNENIIIDSVTLADMVKGTDYTVAYDFERGAVVITLPAYKNAVETIEVSYSETVHQGVSDDVIGIADLDSGIYTGLGCVSLIYQKYNLIPNLICCPKHGADPEVYAAMIKVATKINGHWDAMVYADIPTFDENGATINGTISEAVAWKSENIYTSERSKVFWPCCKLEDGKVIPASVFAVWATVATDATHDGVPMETPSNKAVPVVAQHFGSLTPNMGFDVQSANKLNANGITTVVFWGGQWVLWGPHTAAYKHGADNEDHVIFDTSMRMMFHVSNSFQKDWAVTTDKPMTRALADTIKAREQEKMDALARMGAFVGEPVVEFRESANSSNDILEGNFTWHTKGTSTPPFKSGTLKVAHTSEGYNSFFGKV